MIYIDGRNTLYFIKMWYSFADNSQIHTLSYINPCHHAQEVWDNQGSGIIVAGTLSTSSYQQTYTEQSALPFSLCISSMKTYLHYHLVTTIYQISYLLNIFLALKVMDDFCYKKHLIFSRFQCSMIHDCCKGMKRNQELSRKAQSVSVVTKAILNVMQ